MCDSCRIFPDIAALTRAVERVSLEEWLVDWPLAEAAAAELLGRLTISPSSRGADAPGVTVTPADPRSVRTPRSPRGGPPAEPDSPQLAVAPKRPAGGSGSASLLLGGR